MHRAWQVMAFVRRATCEARFEYEVNCEYSFLPVIRFVLIRCVLIDFILCRRTGQASVRGGSNRLQYQGGQGCRSCARTGGVWRAATQFGSKPGPKRRQRAFPLERKWLHAVAYIDGGGDGGIPAVPQGARFA